LKAFTNYLIKKFCYYLVFQVIFFRKVQILEDTSATINATIYIHDMHHHT